MPVGLKAERLSFLLAGISDQRRCASAPLQLLLFATLCDVSGGIGKSQDGGACSPYTVKAKVVLIIFEFK